MSNASRDCGRLHRLLRTLPVREGRPGDLPFASGIAVFYEVGELGHAGYRIVFAESHDASATLDQIIKGHFSGSKNSDLLRRRIGGAAGQFDRLRDTGRRVDNDCIGGEDGHWDDPSAPACELCAAWEIRTTSALQTLFFFRIIPLEDEDSRRALEKAILGTVAHCRECRPSKEWLGQYATDASVRESGLWGAMPEGVQPLTTQQWESLGEAVGHGAAADPAESGVDDLEGAESDGEHAEWRRSAWRRGPYRPQPPPEDGPPSGVREPRVPSPTRGGPGIALNRYLEGMVGGDPIETLDRRQPNWITEIDETAVWVETLRSRREAIGPQPIPLEWIHAASDTLFSRGQLTLEDLEGPARHRSAFIFAFLALLPGVRSTTRPLELRLE